MNLNEAITRLEVFVKDASEEAPELLDKAIKLSIEALKLIAEQPPEGYTCIPRPLPGETED